MTTEIRKTLFHSRHLEARAKMGIFGGYEMPLWYPSGIKREHTSVLTHAGLFDTSHMALIEISGEHSFHILQTCFSRDMASLSPGVCRYGVFLDENAYLLDDAIVYCLDHDTFLVVVNAGMGPVITNQLRLYSSGLNVIVDDLTDRICKLDLQGPNSVKIAARLLNSPERLFKRFPFFSFKGHFNKTKAMSCSVSMKDGTPILLSRTGYTGELGFEIFMEPDKGQNAWDMLLEVGHADGLIPCGLAARDSLRAGAMLPLSHKDIGGWEFIRNPWEFVLPFNENKTGFLKTFVGIDPLLSCRGNVWTYAFVGFDPRKVAEGDGSAVIDSEGIQIGTVLTCVTDMAIGRYNGMIFSIASPEIPEGFNPSGLCCGFVKVSKPFAYGDIIKLADSRRSVQVEITHDIRPDRTASALLSEFF